MGFEESHFFLVPKGILYKAGEERWFWKFAATHIHLVYQLEDIYRHKMETSQMICKSISPLSANAILLFFEEQGVEMREYRCVILIARPISTKWENY